MSLAIAAVCAGNNFSRPGMLTGFSSPDNSTCGGRPGEKSKSLTLLEARSICRSTIMKFKGGGVATLFGEFTAGDCVLIGFRNFSLRRVVKVCDSTPKPKIN